MSLADAAHAYGSAGLAVLPVNPARPKNPGGYVGKGWPNKSTHNAEQISSWWQRWPNACIALHTGKSGVVAFDLDIDVLPDELGWMREGLFQATRSSGERGHYVFATTETFISGHLGLSDGTVVGEVRSGNSVIITQPSPHHKADSDGGQYRWHRPGVVPPLPNTAHPCLRAMGERFASDHQGGAAPITDDTVRRFIADATGDDRPKALDALVKRVRHAQSATRDETRNALRIAAAESRIGLYPYARAIEAIESAARDSYTERGEDFHAHIGAHEYNRLIANGVNIALGRQPDDIRAEANRAFGTDHRDAVGVVGKLRVQRVGSIAGTGGVQIRERFVAESAFALAQPVPPMRWLVRSVWPERSAGVLAGEKKTFKTWNMQAMGLAVAGGVPFLDQFEVGVPAPVLYLCGEGGRDWFAYRHQVIGDRYGMTLQDLADLPFSAVFDTAELTNTELTDAILRHLDELQPELVILDPLYAYHPANVDAANLYARGPMLAKVRELIEPYAALIIGDHFKKSANGSGAMDLDNISMAGVSQWADTWALGRHRDTPDIANNIYRLEVEFSTRRGGGSRWNIDWNLQRDADPDLVAWKACDWTVSAPAGSGTTTPQRDLELAVVTAVVAAPWTLTRAALHTVIGGRKQDTLHAVKRLLQARELSERDPTPGKGRAAVLGPGKIVVLPPRARQ